MWESRLRSENNSYLPALHFNICQRLKWVTKWNSRADRAITGFSGMYFFLVFKRTLVRAGGVSPTVLWPSAPCTRNPRHCSVMGAEIRGQVSSGRAGVYTGVGISTEHQNLWCGYVAPRAKTLPHEWLTKIGFFLLHSQQTRVILGFS